MQQILCTDQQHKTVPHAQKEPVRGFRRQTCKGTHGLLRSQVAARHQHGLDCFVQEGSRGVHCSLQAVLVADLETQRALVSCLSVVTEPAGQT